MKPLTEGKPVPLILMFAVPMLLGNLLEMLYNVVDSLVVSRILGVGALAAVGATSSIFYLVVGFAMGLAAGLSIVTAQRFGAGDMARVRKSFFTSLVLCLGISLLLMVLGLLCVRPLLHLLGTPAQIIEDSLSYIRVIIIGIAASVLSVMQGNLLRAVGNSRAPLFFLSIACVLNIVLDFLFVGHLGFGVAGAAWATILSQLCSVVLCFLYICLRLKVLIPKREDICFPFSEVWRHLRVGLPMGFQASVISLGTLAVQFTLNRLGPLAIATFSVTEKLDLLVLTVLNTMGLAMATYTAQNYGAGQIGRIKLGLVGVGKVLAVFIAVASGVNFVLGRQLASLFAQGDATVIQMIYTGLRIEAIGFPVLGMLFITRNVLQGLGRSTVPMIASLVELLMRGLAALLLSGWFGYIGVCLANPLAWAASGILLFIAVLQFRK